MADIAFNIEDAICPRCHCGMSYQDLKAMESESVIFRCPSCSKPVILCNGKVKGLTS